jgi:hypothetical protein
MKTLQNVMSMTAQAAEAKSEPSIDWKALEAALQTDTNLADIDRDCFRARVAEKYGRYQEAEAIYISCLTRNSHHLGTLLSYGGFIARVYKHLQQMSRVLRLIK